MNVTRPVPKGYIAPDSNRAHGTRVKYVVECCRCEPCRLANRVKERERYHALHRPDEVWMPYVPAGPVRRHLNELRDQGVGLKTVAKLSGVAHGSLSKLMYGDRTRKMGRSKRVRPETARRIFAVTVDQVEGAQRIDAAPTWVLLDDLITRGFTRSWIATQLMGHPAPALQISPSRVRASTARAVEQLHRDLQGVEAPPKNTRWSK